MYPKIKLLNWNEIGIMSPNTNKIVFIISTYFIDSSPASSSPVNFCQKLGEKYLMESMNDLIRRGRDKPMMVTWSTHLWSR